MREGQETVLDPEDQRSRRDSGCGSGPAGGLEWDLRKSLDTQLGPMKPL